MQPASRLGSRPGRRGKLALVAVLAIGAAIGAVPLYRWRAVEEPRTLCLSNMRRLSVALLLYSQDYNGCMPPPAYRLSDGTWRTWTIQLDPYMPLQGILECPSNPPDSARSPQGYRFPCSYALN